MGLLSISTLYLPDCLVNQNKKMPFGILFMLTFSVRDAAARLPNGEGTRAEICELLKDSQFLAPDVTSAQVPTPYHTAPWLSIPLYLVCFYI